MAKGKDFYGKEVSAVIEDACHEFGVSQEELDIEILETGSTGIFGLCKKKAHIRVQKKKDDPGRAPQKREPSSVVEQSPEATVATPKEESSAPAEPEEKAVVEQEKRPAADKPGSKKEKTVGENKPPEKSRGEQARSRQDKADAEPVAPPSEELLTTVRDEISQLLEHMGYPATVTLKVEETTLQCHLSGEHEEALVGSDGRTLDSLQYLIRKMMSRRLPDRMMFALDAGDFRERRAEELKERARQLAEEVKTSGKTQAIAALNPAERRIVHMILQEDKAIRSRSVGDGLFKKVLIYKPGKGNKSSARRPKGKQSGRTSEN